MGNCVETLDLDLLTLEVKSKEAETVRGVRVSVNSICQVKVDAYEPVEGHEERVLNKKAVSLACQHFLGRSKEDIKMSILSTLEGHQRQILGTLTVEELYKDRAAFSERVREHVFADISAIGFVLVSYTVTKISDQDGYMIALGATQTALVMREAAEGKAKNDMEASKAVSLSQSLGTTAEAENRAKAHVNVTLAKTTEALANRDLNIKAKINTSQAKAEAARNIEAARQQQQVVKEQAMQRVIEAKTLLEYEDNEALRLQKKAEGESLAQLMADDNKAKGVRIKAAAEADRVRDVGKAEADVLIAKGEAEAKVLKLRADAYAAFGQAAITSQIIDKLPEIAKAIAAPLAKTDKMIFVSSDGAAGSKLTSDITTMMAQLGPAVQGLTGVDITQGLQRLVSGVSGAPAAAGSKGDREGLNGDVSADDPSIAPAFTTMGSSSRSSSFRPPVHNRLRASGPTPVNGL
ncbi:hypothetical protein JKP88DRAFT_349251 [Tribonema minus]|uniref:Band 7 domain-containing protein n=1 Tax=Tribonema minus TaxID=303371 RepID=A0A835YT26_9STRA|nr:hypothetical protein JKP88DRAFT_349251 [Tribonema minus]